MAKMSMKKFATSVAKVIEERLAGTTCEEKLVQKNNGIERMALVIKSEDSNIAPTIYLDAYKESLDAGCPMERVVLDIIRLYESSKVSSFNIESYTDWDTVAQTIYMCLINAKTNTEMLADTPHINFLDLALIFKAKVELGSITVKNNHLNLWDKTVDDLFTKANKNSEKIMPSTLRTLSDVLGIPYEMMEMIFGTYLPIYVLSNTEGSYGASAMLYNNFEVLKRFAREKEDDIIIIPSSIHELLLIPASCGECNDISRLVDMIQTVNADELKPQDVLSDHPYKYIKKSNEIISLF